MVKIPKFSGNLLLGVGIVAAAFLLTREIRGAGQDLSESITKGVISGVGTSLQEGLAGIGQGLSTGFGDLAKGFADIKFPEIKFPDFFPTTARDDLSSIAGETIDVGGGTTITIPPETKIDPDTGIVTSPTPPILNLGDVERARALEALRLGRIRAQKEQDLAVIPPSEDISGAEFSRARNEAEFRRRQLGKLPTPDIAPTIPRTTFVETELPIDQQFRGGGVSFIGGTIRENPIDTLREVIKFFPQLTGSQAADFLAETKGRILPSQVDLIDPDIRNIAIAGGDFPTQIQVGGSPLETLSIRESENIKAARFTCQMFGLNCELAESSMA